MSGSTGIIHNLSSSAATFNLLDADRVDANQIQVAGTVKLTGLSTGIGVVNKFLALDSSNNIILTGSEGKIERFVSGSSALYHNLSSSAATFNLLDADRVKMNQISGSTGTIHRVSGSTGTFNLLDSDRIESNQISGSLATYHTISGSTGTYNLIDADRIIINQISGSTSIIHNLSSSAATFNLLDADRVAMNQVSGSSATIHNLSASTSTTNLMDTDRVEVRQFNSTGKLTFANVPVGCAVNSKFLTLDSNNRVVLDTASGNAGDEISGSLATYHRVSGSTGTFNLLDADRVAINQVSGSSAIIHTISGSTGTYNLLDADRLLANQITATSIAGVLTSYLANTSFQESPDNSRTTFTVAQAFVIGSQMVFREGVYMTPGSGNDYTVTNNTTIEFEEAPETDDNLRITYIKS